MARTTPAWEISLFKVRMTARCGLALAPPYLQQKWYGFFASDCSRISAFVVLFRNEHVARGPTSAAYRVPTLWPSSTGHSA